MNITRNRMLLTLITLVTLLVFTPLSRGADDPFGGNPFADKNAGDKLVQTKLLADVAAVEPGGTFTVGLLQTIEPHWHTYWINPGDGGMATTIKWKTDPAVSVSDIHWPIPHRYELAGNAITFGYENEVMLLATVKVPDSAKPGQTLTLDAKAEWLVCKKECLLGERSHTLKVEVKAKREAANGELFEKWRKQVPAALDAAQQDGVVKAFKHKSPAEDSHKLNVRWGEKVKSVTYFPVATNAVAVEGLTTEHEGKKTAVSFTTRVFRPENVPGGVLDGVLVFETEKGERRGVRVPVKVLSDKVLSDSE